MVKSRFERKIEMLSDYQKDVIEEMQNGEELWTDEGSNFKAWLGSKEDRRRVVRVDTVGVLMEKGIIEGDESGINRFKYRLTNE